mmetsp:Transcript_50705/g.99721  ORF Transcript_50705/g.99721 Transcript_50705/m.99721 type:complete len:250 (-) Transcript_50705:445-1194(-)
MTWWEKLEKVQQERNIWPQREFWTCTWGPAVAVSESCASLCASIRHSSRRCLLILVRVLVSRVLLGTEAELAEVLEALSEFLDLQTLTELAEAEVTSEEATLSASLLALLLLQVELGTEKAGSSLTAVEHNGGPGGLGGNLEISQVLLVDVLQGQAGGVGVGVIGREDSHLVGEHLSVHSREIACLGAVLISLHGHVLVRDIHHRVPVDVVDALGVDGIVLQFQLRGGGAARVQRIPVAGGVIRTAVEG